MKKYIYILLVLVLWSVVFTQQSEITKEELAKHLYFLASDSLKGRATGSPELDKAAEYLSSEFKSYGLEPIGDTGYFQYFEVSTGVKLENGNYCKISDNEGELQFELSGDYLPVGFSSNRKINAEMVFAGYGIKAPKLNYDDYSGIDVKDKIILIFRASPGGDKIENQFSNFTSLRTKVNVARDAGAAGVIFISLPDSGNSDNLIKLENEQMGGNSDLAIISCKFDKINNFLIKQGIDLRELKSKIDKTLLPGSIHLKNIKLNLGINISTIKKMTKNVIGLLRGNDETQKGGYIIIGAHYDHLGMGERGSLNKSKEPSIHNGADDNASGTSLVLELAQKAASVKSELRHSVVFALFSGEEMGLLGSSFFVKNSPVNLDQINAMLNFDMVGRLNDEKGLILNGIGSSPDWKELTNKANESHKLKLSFVEDASGGSDHSSFYFKNIPVLFYFTGIHSDYHRPTDKADSINYLGAEKIGRFAFDVMKLIDEKNERIKFTKAKVDTNKQTRFSTKVYVGITPDFAENPDGFKITGVTDGSPAQKAGLTGGDIILKFGEKPVKNIYDYMYAMQQYKPGDIVELIIKRNGKEESIKVTMGSR